MSKGEYIKKKTMDDSRPLPLQVKSKVFLRFSVSSNAIPQDYELTHKRYIAHTDSFGISKR